MAKGGKHLNKQVRSSSAGSRGGAHMPEAEKARASGRGAGRTGRLRAGAPQMIVMLLLCVFMISPLRGCIISGGDFIGYAAAQEIALGDAGIAQDKANDVSAEMIKLDGQMYYKVQFSGSVTDYRYIIDAETGDILAQSFYRTGETGD